MDRETQIKYLKYALNLQEVQISAFVTDVVIETYETMMKLGDDMTFKDVAEIEKTMRLKYKKDDKKG